MKPSRGIQIQLKYKNDCLLRLIKLSSLFKIYHINYEIIRHIEQLYCTFIAQGCILPPWSTSEFTASIYVITSSGIDAGSTPLRTVLSIHPGFAYFRIEKKPQQNCFYFLHVSISNKWYCAWKEHTVETFCALKSINTGWAASSCFMTHFSV